MQKRSSFTNKLGFVMAAAGSAVGLGNIWRFPYLAAKYGGGTFLLIYLIPALTFGFSLMTAEIALGRKTGFSAIGAFSALDNRFGFLGLMASIVPIIIFPYYSVIGGWVMKYFSVFITGQAQAAASDAYFNEFISGTREPLGWFALFLALTALVVLGGVQKGIERISKVLMPVLVVLTVVIAIYGLTLDGAIDGLLYYVTPHMSDVSAMTFLTAMGQMFFSMSLAMGIMITYGSYMKKNENLESCVHQIELFDTAIAFLAGLMIVPAVYTFSGGDPEALSAGPGLMFITLPKVFASMPFGTFVGIIFFLLVFFAALTSAISLMEAIVSEFRDQFGWSRRFTCIFVAVLALLIGIPCSLGFGPLNYISILGMDILDFLDFVSNSILMPLVALGTCLFIGFVIQPQAVIEEAETDGNRFGSQKMFTVIIKWVAPIFLVLILLSSVSDALGWLTI